MKIVYTAAATAIGGREGRVTSSDGVLDLEVRMPQEGSKYTNPEQLFAAGYAACFGSALNMIIRMGNIQTGETAVTANVSLGKTDAHVYNLAVELHAKIPGVDKATAEELIAKAHEVCPYSNATRGNVEVKLTVEV